VGDSSDAGLLMIKTLNYDQRKNIGDMINPGDSFRCQLTEKLKGDLMPKKRCTCSGFFVEFIGSAGGE